MTNSLNWRPSASIDCLIKRNQILGQIRDYFSRHNVLEVETPTLSPSTVTDLHLEAMETLHTNPLSVKKTHLYLQTSPEYYMKRLLCAGAPSIFQIVKCFRDDEVGRYHNPEFTLLEWYRLSFSMESLIEDVDSILRLVLDTPHCEKVSYRELFIKHLDIDLKCVSDEKIVSICNDLGYENLVPTHFSNTLSIVEKDTLLQLLFCEKIETQIGTEKPIVVTHFPASQASLAKLSEADPSVSQRFEFYYKGVELANGFEELSEESEQRVRFNLDNSARVQVGLAPKPIDEKFLNALKEGLPNCAGVALGIDRLLMLALDKKQIREVISFDFGAL
jgi:lysyl-tRNA synthetase class 2